MSNLSDVYNDEMLNVGKILAIQKGHKLSILEIKKVINAKKVKKLKWNDGFDIDSFLLSKINEGSHALDDSDFISYDVYYVTGDDAISSFLRMKISSKCFTFNWNAKSIKILHNALHTKAAIDTAKNQMSRAKIFHDCLIESLNSQKLNNLVKKKTKSLEKILDGYGDEELLIAMGKIEAEMKNVW